MLKTYFPLLIIYILFSSEAFGQNLHLILSGKDGFETKVIDSVNYKKTHKDYQSISIELKAVQNTIFKLGYIENKADLIRKTNDSTFTSIIELKKRYHTIYIYYNKETMDKSTLNLVSQHVNDSCFVLTIKDIESSLDFINSRIASKGLPFSKLQLSDIEVTDGSNLKAQLSIISENKKRLIDNIVVKGYDKFPKAYVKHYLKIKPSQTFDLKTIERKMGNLNDLKFANQIKPPEVLFSKDSTTLYIYIEKAKSNSFDGFLGFGTNETTNKLQFDGYLNLNLINNLNYGESFKLLYKSDENDQKNFQTNLTLPYLFSSPLGIDLKLNIFKRDSTFTTVNQDARLHYQLNSRSKFYVGISSNQSNNLLNNPTTSVKDYNSSFFSQALEYSKPQIYNLLFPINTMLYLETAFGKRTTSLLSEKQTRLKIEMLKIFNLNDKNSVFFKINGDNLISKSYFENELLRFGGINSIRGFEENSVLASVYGILNTEYRFQISNRMYIHSITDIAYFENSLTDTKEKLYGYGFGFGILTNSGLLKLNYANGKSENQKFKFSNSKIHISLTANF